MRWTQAQLDAYEARRRLQNPKPEHPVRPDPMGQASGEKGRTEGCAPRIVRITSFRTRLLDADNLAGGCKFLIDALRYTKTIPDDDPESITLDISQRKVDHRHQEHTVVEIV